IRKLGGTVQGMDTLSGLLEKVGANLVLLAHQQEASTNGWSKLLGVLKEAGAAAYKFSGVQPFVEAFQLAGKGSADAEEFTKRVEELNQEFLNLRDSNPEKVLEQVTAALNELYSSSSKTDQMEKAKHDLEQLQTAASKIINSNFVKSQDDAAKAAEKHA